MFHDELRAGTRTELGRKWSPTGHRSVGRVLIGYQYVYLYLALCPFTGRGYASFLPQLSADRMRWFVKQIEGCIEGKVLFVADGASAHSANAFAESRVSFCKLPPYCPELNGSGQPSGRASF